jgi:uncharacterized membrane protein
MTMRSERTERSQNVNRALIGAAAVMGAAGAALVIGSKMRERQSRPWISDAPRSAARWTDGPQARTVTINRPAQEIYDFWRDFSNLARVMENIERIDVIDDKRSHWVVKGPAGTRVEWEAIVRADEPGRRIAWSTAEGADVENSGAVEFIEQPAGRGTLVRATIHYAPPGGKPGRLLAKLLQREPDVQLRRDLRRLKQFLETGEVTTSASPSGRKGESPTEQTL